MFDILKTDRSIIRNVLRGRTDRFGVLVDRYGRLVYAIAYAYLRNPQDAEDVVQESYTRLYERLDTLAWKQNIGPWLAQVARNVAVDRLRKRERQVLVAEQPPASITHLPNPARDEMRQLVAEQLEHLDTADREVLLLHYFLGKKAREIAGLLEIQPDAAAKRLQRARDELGRRLVDVLKQDLVEDRADPARRRRVMAAIAATAIPWKPSAAAAAAVSVITGASATKGLTIVAAATAVVFAGLFVGLKLWHPRLPFLSPKTQTTSQYTANIPPKPVDATAATANGTQKASAEPAPAPRPDAAVVAKQGPGRSVSGIVVTEQGKPVPGAEVTIDNFAIAKRQEGALRNDITIAPLTPLQFSTISRQDGMFSFASFPFILDSSYNKIEISAEAGGLGGRTSLCSTPDLIDEFVRITVYRDASLAGIVTDTAGTPIGNALLFPDARETDAGPPMYPSPCWTKPDGTFLITHVMRGEFRFEVGAAGYGTLKTDWFPSGKTDIVIKLGGRNSISGRVIENATGTPVVDGSVLVSWEGSYSHTRTDAEGKFTVEGLTPGTAKVKFVTRGNPPSPYILSEPVVVNVVEGRPVTGLEVRVFRGAILSGQVSDAASGAPVKDAVVKVKTQEATPNNPFPHQVVKTNADGHYDAPGLPPGDVELVAQAKDYVEKSMKIHVGDLGQTQQVDVKIEMMSAVQGALVGSTGEPVAGASVVAVYSSDNTAPWPDPAISDATGNFRLNLPKNNPVRLQARSQGAISPVSGAVMPGARDVVLRLADGGSIEGTVVDAAGGPVASANVSITPVNEQAQEILLFRFMYDNPEKRALRTPQDGPSTLCPTHGGFFRSGLLLAGHYDLNVYPPLSESAAGITRVRVRAGQTTQTLLQMGPASFGAIEGRVTVNGLPRSGLTLGVCGICAKTDEDGRYRISPAPAGSVIVGLNMQGTQREQTADVTPGETTTVDFDLAMADTVVEGIVRVNGQPLPQVSVILYPANSDDPQSRVTFFTDAEGSFRARNLAEGAYQCEVVSITRVLSRPELVLRETREISVAAGSTTKVEFDLAGAAIECMLTGLRKNERGVVCLLTGDAEISEISPAALATLATKAVAGESLSADGVVRFFGITPGPYVVAAVAIPAGSPDDEPTLLENALAGRYAAVQVQAPPGEIVQVDVPLP